MPAACLRPVSRSVRSSMFNVYFFLVSQASLPPPPPTHTQIDDRRSYYLYSEHRAPAFAMKPFRVECRAIRFIIIFQLKQQLLYDPEKKFTCRETNGLAHQLLKIVCVFSHLCWQSLMNLAFQRARFMQPFLDLSHPSFECQKAPTFIFVTVPSPHLIISYFVSLNFKKK